MGGKEQAMSKSFKPAEVFPPGDFIREELEERGWTQAEFAAAIGRPLQAVNEIVNGKKRITAETAKEIGLAFGTGPEVWLNLQNAYDLFVAPEADPQIEKRVAALG
jgi:HTH-type transcriptional regulator/antitoxin HigA